MDFKSHKNENEDTDWDGGWERLRLMGYEWYNTCNSQENLIIDLQCKFETAIAKPVLTNPVRSNFIYIPLWVNDAAVLEGLFYLVWPIKCNFNFWRQGVIFIWTESTTLNITHKEHFYSRFSVLNYACYKNM